MSYHRDRWQGAGAIAAAAPAPRSAPAPTVGRRQALGMIRVPGGGFVSVRQPTITVVPPVIGGGGTSRPPIWNVGTVAVSAGSAWAPPTLSYGRNGYGRLVGQTTVSTLPTLGMPLPPIGSGEQPLAPVVSATPPTPSDFKPPSSLPQYQAPVASGSKSQTSTIGARGGGGGGGGGGGTIDELPIEEEEAPPVLAPPPAPAPPKKSNVLLIAIGIGAALYFLTRKR